MTRNSLFVSVALTPLLVGLAAGQGQDFSDVEITAHPVAGQVYYLEGRGGTSASSSVTTESFSSTTSTLR